MFATYVILNGQHIKRIGKISKTSFKKKLNGLEEKYGGTLHLLDDFTGSNTPYVRLRQALRYKRVAVLVKDLGHLGITEPVLDVELKPFTHRPCLPQPIPAITGRRPASLVSKHRRDDPNGFVRYVGHTYAIIL